VTLLAAGRVRADEPLCNALSNLGRAAEAAHRGEVSSGLQAARGARAALPLGPLGAQAAAMLGLALLEAQRPTEALEPLQDALATPPVGAEGELRLALGRAFLESGRPAEALVQLAEASRLDTAPSPSPARWLEAEAHLAAGRAVPAIQRLEALLARGGETALARRGRFLLAGARRLVGRDDEARAAYRALAIEQADSPEGAQAAAALQAWAEAGSAGARLSGDDRLRRAERWLQVGRAAEALTEGALAMGLGPPTLRSSAALVQALALLGLGRLAEAVELAQPLERSTDPGTRRGAHWVLARAASRAGRTEEATARYATVAGLAATIPGLGDRRSREAGDEAAYLAAWLWYDAGQFARAASRLDAFVQAHPVSPRADDARWFAAWSSHRAGDRPGALRRLAGLETGPLAEAAFYWEGRLAGSPGRARERLRRAALTAGDGWYGWLARRRLERLGAVPPAPTSGEAPWPGPVDPGSLARLRSASALLALGRRAGAVQVLEAEARRATSRATAEEACRLATFAGEPAAALRVARDLLGVTPRTERWLYPIAFEDQLAASARDAGIEEALLLALVRRESGFVPTVRSSVGAVGLGQLLPGTAERLGVLAGLATDPAQRLTEPTTNLPLAALYLGLLQDRFGSDVAAVAAYNAGPLPPAAWATSRAGQPLDEWVENVPYKETRVYLKNVLSAREVYRRLIGRPPVLDPATLVQAPITGVGF
jgi:soluble lytic murein transglycosylase